MKTALPDFIRFGRAVCGDLEQAERREWWLSNGLGAFAAGTIAGTLTRRYHGLLVAPVHPPLGRHLLMAKADARLTDGEREWPLFTNRWRGGAIEPAGHRLIESFRLDGRMPVWQYACDELRIEQRVWMEHGRHTTHVAWRLNAGDGVTRMPLQLRVRLLVNARDFHGNARAWEFNPVIEAREAKMRVSYPNLSAMYLTAVGGSLETRHDWYENFDLLAEGARGLPDVDAHLCVGEAVLPLHADEWTGVIASLDAEPSVYLEESLRRARAHDLGQLRRAQVQVPALLDAPDWIDQLVLAADSFVFARPLPTVPEGESVIAGFPWFGDWGRDTMIALPGLTLATGRFDTARRILETFLRFVDQGMLPNVFPGAGDAADYNTVDAALWYIEAWRAYVDALDDLAALRAAYPVLESIIDWHVAGTRFGIGVDAADGLLRAGEPGVQLTWMDAKLADWVVTPRIGKPVEINALWFNALRAMAGFARRLKKPAERYDELAERVGTSFQRFVRGEAGLFDVLDSPHGDDATVRPNQIFAVSLAHTPLDAQAQAQVVREVGRELLTSHGLRSLSPRHADYRPRYEGRVWERDSAYHQGPVWAFLLGHYALAHLRVHGDLQAAQALLEPMRDHLLDAGLGTVSEIFDGAAPHVPRGAPAQAWSVACTLEAWWRLEKARQLQASPAALAVA